MTAFVVAFAAAFVVCLPFAIAAKLGERAKPDGFYDRIHNHLAYGAPLFGSPTVTVSPRPEFFDQDRHGG